MTDQADSPGGDADATAGRGGTPTDRGNAPTEAGAAADPGPISINAACIACGYNLRGLNRAGVCPECGKPCADSLQPNLLAFAPAGYVRRLHRGAKWIALSIALPLAALAIALLGRAALAWAAWAAGGSFLAPAIVLAAGPFVFFYGWAVFTPADGGRVNGLDPPGRLWAVNTAIGGPLLLAFGCPCFCLSGPSPGNSVESVLLLAAAALTLLSALHAWHAMAYVYSIALRVPDDALARRADAHQLAIPLLLISALLTFGLGAVIGVVMYWFTINALRKRLGAIARRQAELQTERPAGLP